MATSAAARPSTSVGHARRQPDADACQLLLGVGIHPPAIEQTEAAAAGFASQEDVAGDVERVDDLELLVDDGDPEARGVRR